MSVLRPSRMRGAGVTLALLAPGLVAFLALFCYPLLLTLVLSLRPNGETTGWTLANYTSFLGSREGLRVIWLTTYLAVISTAASILFTIPLVLILRERVRGGKLFRGLILAPMMAPHLISTLGLLLFWGSTGWANLTLLKLLPFVDDPLKVNFTPGGLILFYVWLFFPYTALLALSALEGLDRSIEEAAEVAGASRWQVIRTIVIPLIMPAIVAGSILTFMQAFGTFSVPLLAGGEHRPLAVQIYTTSAVFRRWSLGSAMAVVMALVQVIFLLGYIRIFGRKTQ